MGDTKAKSASRPVDSEEKQPDGMETDTMLPVVNEVVTIVPPEADLPPARGWRQTRTRLLQCPGIGQVFIALSCVTMTSAAAIVKLNRSTDPFLTASLRNVVVATLATSSALASKTSIFPRGKLKLLLCRSLSGNSNLLLMYYAFRNLPLGDCRMIAASAPIFVTFLARLFLKEPCGIFEVFNLIFTMLGILVVMQPPIIFGEDEHGLDYQTHHFIAAFMAFLGTIMASFGMVCTRVLKDVNLFVVSTWNGLLGMFPGLIISLCLGTFSIPSLESCLYLLALGVLSFIGQLLMTAAFRFEEAGIISLSRKAEDILLAFLIQILYFEDIPSNLTIIGAIIVTVCVLISGIRKILEKSHHTPNTLRIILCLLPWDQDASSLHSSDAQTD